MPPRDANDIERENHGLRTQLGALKNLLQEAIQAKSSLQDSLNAESERFVDLTARAPWVVARVSNEGVYLDANQTLHRTITPQQESVLDRKVGSCGECPNWTSELGSFAASPDILEREVTVSVEVAGQTRIFLALLSRSRRAQTFSVLAFDQTERLEAQKNAERASAAKSEFLALMSHAMGTPMGGILGLSSLLLGSDLDDEERGMVEAIHASGEVLSDVMEDVIQLAKDQDRPPKTRPEPFQARDLLEQAVVQAQRSDIGERFRIELNVEAGVPDQLEGARDRIRRCVVHALQHAMESAPRGSLQIQCEYRGQSRDAGELRLAISVAPDLRESELGHSRSDTGPAGTFQRGTGLGGSMARGFAASVGGRVEDSAAGGDRAPGTVFYLPVKLASPPAVTTPDLEPLGAPERPLKVLVAEDNPVNRRVAEGILRRAGYDVACAENGVEAVEKATKAVYDLILMDVDMPVMDGIEATREIRVREHSGEIDRRNRIVALTANAIGGDRDSCLAAGMDDHMNKPLRPDRLALVLPRSELVDGGPNAGRAN